MLKRLKRVAIGVAIVIGLYVGFKVYEGYRFQKAHQRAMELLGEGHVIRP